MKATRNIPAAKHGTRPPSKNCVAIRPQKRFIRRCMQSILLSAKAQFTAIFTCWHSWEKSGALQCPAAPTVLTSERRRTAISAVKAAEGSLTLKWKIPMQSEGRHSFHKDLCCTDVILYFGASARIAIKITRIWRNESWNSKEAEQKQT